MEEKQPIIEPAVDAVLDDLLHLLTQKEEIVRYQNAEEQVNGNRWIQDMIEIIKEKQKELVNFEYYEKPKAYRITLQELEELNQQLKENITVRHYQDTLVEADEIVQLIFSRLQDTINEN